MRGIERAGALRAHLRTPSVDWKAGANNGIVGVLFGDVAVARRKGGRGVVELGWAGLGGKIVSLALA